MWLLGQRRGKPVPRGGPEQKETEGKHSVTKYEPAVRGRGRGGGERARGGEEKGGREGEGEERRRGGEGGEEEERRRREEAKRSHLQKDRLERPHQEVAARSTAL